MRAQNTALRSGSKLTETVMEALLDSRNCLVARYSHTSGEGYKNIDTFLFEPTWGSTPLILADQFNPILTKRGRLCPPHYYWHPWIRAQMVVLIKAEIRTGEAPPLWRNSGGRRRFRVIQFALSWVRSPVAT